MRATLASACIALCIAGADASPLRAQSLSLWIDAHAAHTRPPANTPLDAASYGLAGARLRLDGKGSALELGASAGRGSSSAAGMWTGGRASYSVSRVIGMLDISLLAQGNGTTFLTPITLGDDSEYSQSLFHGSIRPGLGLSIAGTRVSATGMYARGGWQSSTSTQVVSDPSPLPLPRPGGIEERTVEADGGIVVAGGTLSLLRMFGRTGIELSASTLEAQNQVASGRYSGVDATITTSLGMLDLMAGARRWRVPDDDAQLGGHAGFGVALGDGAYLQAIVSRSVSDPVTGIAGDLGFSAGISLRVGRRSLGGPLPAAVGAAAPAGRVVRFSLRHDARTVEVAGDFSNWERRAMQRGADGTWALETVIAPGVYHYAFVIDGETWMVPDGASGIVDDGFGNRNATLVVAQEEIT